MNVLSVEIARAINGYPTAAAAIAATKADSRQPNARSDGAQFAGHTFVGGRWSYARWCLEFSGPLWVDITCRDDEVDWRVVHDLPEFEPLAGQLAMRWPSGEESVIDPQKLFAERVGAEFWQFWVNESGFYVYLRRKLILCFHAVRDVQSGQCVLAVAED